ncbi:Hypothetical predicted protein [Cloeon dipterum]|uniref:HTH OST-type domain-containing protein n=1 Tax=Cloeon dipterum TaxID=197152 RepID=A0A8S1D5C2_9INSE|nr:Hypothetical predicted protein [Cloeon dipterum]
MNPPNEQKVVKMITSILVTEKKCMSPHELMRQYRDQVGENIPYVKLGYNNLIELLQTIPGMSVASGMNRETLLAYDASHTSSGHIQQLVMRQKNQPKKIGRPGTFRPPMQMRSTRYINPHSSYAPPPRQMPVITPPVYHPVQPVPLFVPSQMQLKASMEAARMHPMVATENLQLRPVLCAEKQLAPAFKNLSTSAGGRSVRFEKENVYIPHLSENKPAPSVTDSPDVKDSAQPQPPLLVPKVEKIVIPKVEKIEKFSDVLMPKTDENLNLITPKKEDLVEFVVRPRTVRTDEPMLLNYQFLGDDFLLYFAYRNLKGKIRKDSKSIWCGMSYSGLNTRNALLLVEQNRNSQWHKMIVMLGYMDILESNYNFEKSKLNMLRILDTLSEKWLQSLKPGGEASLVGRRHKTNRLSEEAPNCVTIVDLKYAFFTNLAWCGTYKSQQHCPLGKTFSIGMWTHSTRKFVYNFLSRLICPQQMESQWPSEFPVELRHLIATNKAAEEVLADRHALIEVDKCRQNMRVAARAIEQSAGGPDERITLLTGAVMLKLPKKDVQSILKKDLLELDIESNRIRSELKEKVNLVQELELKDPLKGFDLKPLSKVEMAAVGQVLGRSYKD